MWFAVHKQATKVKIIIMTMQDYVVGKGFVSCFPGCDQIFWPRLDAVDCPIIPGFDTGLIRAKRQ